MEYQVKAEIRYLVIWRRWACRSRQGRISSLYTSSSLTPTSRLHHLSSSSSSLCMEIFHLSSHSSRRRTRRKRRRRRRQHEWVFSQEKWVVVRIKTKLQRNDDRWGLVLRNAAMLRAKEQTVGSLSMTCSTARRMVRIPDHMHCEDQVH
jgi:hypothetical protein